MDRATNRVLFPSHLQILIVVVVIIINDNKIFYRAKCKKRREKCYIKLVFESDKILEL